MNGHELLRTGLVGLAHWPLLRHQGADPVRRGRAVGPRRTVGRRPVVRLCGHGWITAYMLIRKQRTS